MPDTIKTTTNFDEWFEPLDEAVQDSIIFVVGILEEHGPSLRRPYADSLKGSSLSNLKELRVQHQGKPYRILFAFDPEREALLLIGGNKAADKRWYDKMIPLAESLFKEHLESLKKGQN